MTTNNYDQSGDGVVRSASTLEVYTDSFMTAIIEEKLRQSFSAFNIEFESGSVLKSDVIDISTQQRFGVSSPCRSHSVVNITCVVRNLDGQGDGVGEVEQSTLAEVSDDD